MTWRDFVSQASGAAFGLFCAPMFWRWRTRRDAEWRRKALAGEVPAMGMTVFRLRLFAFRVLWRALLLPSRHSPAIAHGSDWRVRFCVRVLSNRLEVPR